MPTPWRVVLPNAAGGIGWLVNYAIYDGSVDLKELRTSFGLVTGRLSDAEDGLTENFQPETQTAMKATDVRANYRSLSPTSTWWECFPQAVKALRLGSAELWWPWWPWKHF